MEQFNDQHHDSYEEDRDVFFENVPVPVAPVHQARNVPQIFPGTPSVLTDAQVWLGYQVDTASSSIYNQSDPISQMLRKLEESVINEKDAEISVLKSELEEKNKEIVQCNEKMTKLVDYITFVHGQFGKLLRSLMVMEIQDETNILRLGPFKNETTKTEFIQNLNVIATNFLSDFENLTRTRELFEKINSILSSKENMTMTSEQSGNTIYHGNTNQVHSSNEEYNEGQEIPLFPPINTTGLSPSSCIRDMPPPPANVSISQDINVGNFGVEYPVLSIPESLPNCTVSSSNPLSSNVTMEPPPSPFNFTMRRPPPSISRNSLQTDYGINLATANKKHGIDHSKGHWGFFCLCNTRFNNSGKLKDHIQYFTMKKFECVICKKRYHKDDLLKLHMISSHKIESVWNGILTCSICHGNYQNWNEVREHLIKFHGIEKRRVFAKQSNFANGSSKHARDEFTDIPHRCICGKIYSHQNTLTLHIKTKLYGNIFKCSCCTKMFQTHAELKLHLGKIHGVEQDKQNKFGCTECGKTFPTLAEIRKHRSEVHR